MIRITFVVYLVIVNLSSASGQDNETVVKAIFSAFNRHDWKSMLANYDSRAVFIDPSFEAPVNDQSKILAHHQEMVNYFPDIHDEIKSIFACRDIVVVEFVAWGKGTDGRSFQLPICTVFTLRNGKVIRDATYYDLNQ